MMFHHASARVALAAHISHLATIFLFEIHEFRVATAYELRTCRLRN